MIFRLQFNPLPDDKILDWSKLKGFADENFNFYENGRKVSKRVENTVGKEKLLVMSNFSFSHSGFKRLVSQGRQKVSLCGNGLNLAEMIEQVFKTGEKNVGKGENAGHQHFFPFSTMFPKAFFFKFVKSQDCVEEGLCYFTCF